MGTSSSQRSPHTPNWHLVSSIYMSPEISIDRAVEEIWRAAKNQPEISLTVDLGRPIIAKCLEIIQTTEIRAEAIHNVKHTIAESGECSLATDIAQRATTQASVFSGDRTLAFVKSLFSEAGDYLVSRDLSGYVGSGKRIQTISELIEFKNSIRGQIINIVSKTSLPRGSLRDPNNWRGYVESIIGNLTGGNKNV